MLDCLLCDGVRGCCVTFVFGYLSACVRLFDCLFVC